MLCRLCVEESSDFKDIFKDDGLKIDILKLISKYFTFQISPDDGISTIVCKNCLDKLCSFSEFCSLVEDAQEKWQIIIDLQVKDEEEQLYEEDQFEEASSSNDNDEVLIKDEEERILNFNHNENQESYSQVTERDSQKSHQEKRSKKTLLSEQFDRLISSHTTLFCNKCNKQMKNFRLLKKHFKEHHDQTGYMICCKRKFFRAADLADHINIHLNPEYFKCKQCNKCFSSRNSLDFHLKTFHVDETGENKSFKCEQCPRKFLSKDVLKRHKQTHSEGELDDNEHLCTECGKGYPNESKLKAHRFNVHTMVYSRMCHLCGKIVRGNKALERHQLQHSGIKPKVQCEICGTELSTKGILKAHIIALHPEDSSETHVCNLCGKTASSKRALKYHMDYVHKCERSHKCNLCDKSFKRLQTLKEHLTTHTGDRLYECPHCPKTFKVRSNMHHHRKLKHPKEFEETRRNRLKIK